MAASPAADSTASNAIDAGRPSEWLADGFTLDAGAVWTAVAADGAPRTLTRVEALDLRSAASARLTFQSWLSAPSSRASIEVSTGNGVWERVVTVATSDGWIPVDVDLGAYVGEAISVRFVLITSAPPDTGPPDTWRVEGIAEAPVRSADYPLK